MKKSMVFLFLLSLLSSNVYSQNKSNYQEYSLRESDEKRESNPIGTHYYKSIVHFRNAYYNNYMGFSHVYFAADEETVHVSSDYDFSEMKLFQLCIIYYEKRWFNTPELAPVPDNKRL